MARKFLYLVATLVVLVIAGLIALRFFAQELSEMAFVPRTAFKAQPPLRTNAYADPKMWISRPEFGSGDPVRWLPEGFRGEDAQGLNVAVFFVHPTSYLARERWNAAVDEPESRSRADLFVRGLASPFNAAPRLWAPRYRQAAFGAFLSSDPAARRALDVAYGDVTLAFDHFAAQVPEGTPIVLAGHSQGALMVMQLLRDRVAGKPLARRIVAAYVIGWPVSIAHDLPAMGLAACDDPEQTGCVISWNSFAEPAEPADFKRGIPAATALDGQPRMDAPPLCTNPLTGKMGGSAPASANTGTLFPSKDLSKGVLRPGAVPARCDPSGLLLIGPPPEMGPYMLPGNNYHVYDIPLFWQNLREDFRRRTLAWKP